MNLTVRRSHVIKSTQWESEGIASELPLEKLAVVLVLQNPYCGRYIADLSDMIAASEGIGRRMAKVAVEHCDPASIQSYGKGGIVGVAGEQEHANALLTTVFANPFRDAIGGGKAWISSVTKVGGPGTLIDVPMNHKDDVYVRSHYDAMSIALPDTPLPDEIALIFCMANRGRLNARVGGLAHDEVIGR
jgi:hypothetical protein